MNSTHFSGVNSGQSAAVTRRLEYIMAVETRRPGIALAAW